MPLLSKIQRDPTTGFVLVSRGLFFASRGDFGPAIKELTNDVLLDANDALTLNNIAWIWATCRDDDFRDGKRAVEFATKACELSQWKLPGCLETLAAAYAEAGDFGNAIQWTEKVIEVRNTAAKPARDLIERLALLKVQTPIRDGPKNVLDFYSKPIEKEPTNAVYWTARGSYWQEKGEFENAIRDFNEAIRLDPMNANVFASRGESKASNGELDGGIGDMTEAIRLDPGQSRTYVMRGAFSRNKGDFHAASADFTMALTFDDNDAFAYCLIAYFRATCPDEFFRNGLQAVESATKACDLTAWEDWQPLDTLAAACAESGDFATAVKWAQRSLELVGDKEKAVVKERLELFRANQPYRCVQQSHEFE